jgi:hypothetical protein
VCNMRETGIVASLAMNTIISGMTQLMTNQPPVSANRGQNGSKICFGTFLWRKITKLLIIQQPPMLKKLKKHRLGFHKILVIFGFKFGLIQSINGRESAIN